MRLIDADYLTELLREQKVKQTGKLTEGINKGLNTAISLARNPDACPTIEAKPVVHGEWVNAICTECAFDLRCLTDGESDLEQWVWDEGFDYCPNCGADMRGRKET